jgi:hydrogenase maturation factor HypF (carbamoyltransferase family)
LDAISLLLGFCQNKRDYKHQPIDLLEKSSTKSFSDLKLKTIKNRDGNFILDTTHLFKYVLEYVPKYLPEKINLKNRKRLAATAQFYISQGLYEIIRKQKEKGDIFISGGLANNKIISSFLESRGAYGAKKIPRGDAGLSFGQIVYYLMK